VIAIEVNALALYLCVLHLCEMITNEIVLHKLN